MEQHKRKGIAKKVGLFLPKPLNDYFSKAKDVDIVTVTSRFFSKVWPKKRPS